MTTDPIAPQSQHPYQLQSFYDCWWQHLAPKFNIIDAQNNLATHRRTVLKGVRLNELRYAGWNNAWFQNFDQQCYEQFTAVKANKNWDYFSLIWPESRRDEQSFQPLTSMGLEIILKPHSTAYWVDLPDGFEAYLDTLSAAKRKDIRRKLKKAEPLHPEMRRFSGPEGIQQFFSIFFKHHLAYWKEKTGQSYFSDPRERAFILAWAEALDQEGHLLLEGFYVNNTLTNLTMNILMDGTLYSLITINTGEYPELAPGLLSLYYRMAHAQEYNIRHINMGDGEHGYKPGIATRTDAYHALYFANPQSVAGLAYVNYIKLKKTPLIPEPLLSGITLKMPELKPFPISGISLKMPALKPFPISGISLKMPALNTLPLSSLIPGITL